VKSARVIPPGSNAPLSAKPVPLRRLKTPPGLPPAARVIPLPRSAPILPVLSTPAPATPLKSKTTVSAAINPAPNRTPLGLPLLPAPILLKKPLRSVQATTVPAIPAPINPAPIKKSLTGLPPAARVIPLPRSAPILPVLSIPAPATPLKSKTTVSAAINPAPNSVTIPLKRILTAGTASPARPILLNSPAPLPLKQVTKSAAIPASVPTVTLIRTAPA